VIIAIRSRSVKKHQKDQTTWPNYWSESPPDGLLALRERSPANWQRCDQKRRALEVPRKTRREETEPASQHATYWLHENADTIIRFRAWIKTGRAEELFYKTTSVTPELAV